MRKLSCFVVFLLFAGFVTAAIVPIDSPKEAYNLGDSLRVSYSVSREQGIEALFRANLVCNSYVLPYFTTPVSLVPREKLLVQVPSIRFSEQMLGSCSVRAFFESLKGDLIEDVSSHNFSVSDKLDVKAAINKNEFLPGDEVVVAGDVKASYGAYGGPVAVTFDESRDFVTADADKFTHTIQIARDFKSGNHSVAVFVNDSFGNSGGMSFSIRVAQVPTSFSLELNDASFLPNSTMRMFASLIDQSGDKMAADVDLKVFGPGLKVVFSKIASAGEVVAFTFAQFAEPGSYSVEASSSGFKEKKGLTMKEYENLDITYYEKFVSIHNTGNVPYDKEVEIRLTAGGKEYRIVRRVSLKPDESVDINLFSEVPAGTYNVGVMPEDQPSSVFEGVKTVDERPLSKKLTGGLSAPLSSGRKSFLAPIVLIAFVIILIFYFGNRSQFPSEMRVQRKQFEETVRKTGAFEPQRKAELPRKIELQRDVEPFRQVREARTEEAAKKAIEDLRNDPEVKKFIQQQLKGR